jgi:hypothetical protein
MGVILQGILGGFSGKVGPVVGGKWKDVDYMRSYVTPANPNTVGQQAQRTKFASAVSFAREILSTVLQPFWDPFYSNMSGFNAWISDNINLLDGSNLLTASAVMAKGTLEPLQSMTALYNTVNGQVTTTGDGTCYGNGLATDDVYIVMYDKTSGNLACVKSAEARDFNSWPAQFVAGYTATNVIVWAFCSRGTGASLLVSDSLGDVCAAP